MKKLRKRELGIMEKLGTYSLVCILKVLGVTLIKSYKILIRLKVKVKPYMIRLMERPVKVKSHRIQENPDRNFLVYELWEKGFTVDEIVFETGIPRSSVGYYVRKFNKCAKSGKPIVIQQIKKKPDEKALPQQAWIKSDSMLKLKKMFIAEDVDKAYKYLMTIKLMKELQRELNPTEEERQAFMKIFPDVVEQMVRRQAAQKNLRESETKK